MPGKSGSKRRSNTATGKKRRVTGASKAGKAAAKAKSGVQGKRKKAQGQAGKSTAKPVLSFRPRTNQDDRFILDLTEGELGSVHQNSFGEPFPREQFLGYLQSGAPTTIVELNQKPIGYYSYLVGPDGKMHVSALVIQPKHQAGGMGTEVMAHLENEARQQGVHTMEVFVQNVNDRSIAFTRKLGFVEAYRIPPNTICFQKPVALPEGQTPVARPAGWPPAGVQAPFV